MRIAVEGSGYVGQVTGTCFAESGNSVVCIDIDGQRVARLQRGEMPIYEPGLEELVRKNLKSRRLRFSTDLGPAVLRSEVVFIAVIGTSSERARHIMGQLYERQKRWLGKGDLKALRAVMRGNAIFDGRNVLDPLAAREEGFSYYGIGRPG